MSDPFMIRDDLGHDMTMRDIAKVTRHLNVLDGSPMVDKESGIALYKDLLILRGKLIRAVKVWKMKQKLMS